MFVRNRFHAVKPCDYAPRDARGRPRKDDTENFNDFTESEIPLMTLTDRLLSTRAGTPASRALVAELLQAVK